MDLGVLDDIAREVNEEFHVEFRDPTKDPYLKYTKDGEPRTTGTQAKAWELLAKHDVWRIAMIAAKGCGKTHFGAMFAFYFGQKYPGTHGCIVANTDRQAQDAAGEAFVRVANILGYDCEYFRSKKIKGQQYSKFYCVDLDGKGYQDGHIFMLMVRSFESVQAMEGSEFDFLWVEEIQDANRDKFVIAMSRNRGTHIADEDTPNPLFIAGMTESELHWMYDMVEKKLGMVTEDEFNVEEHRGILYEPNLYDNKKNVGQATIDSYLESMDTQTAQRHVYAQRTSSSNNLVLHEYRDDIHRKGRMSELLCHYDPYNTLYLSVDFNVSPMCATVWQEKRWNDSWLDNNLLLRYDQNGEIKQVEEYVVETESEIFSEDIEPWETYESIENYAEPDDTVLAQVDEFEVWNGGTEGLMDEFVAKYGEHPVDVIIIGDATGNRRDTRSSTTDWNIIREKTRHMNNCIVIPGLEQSTNFKKGETKYSNPNRRDTINVLNSVLMNAKGKARICFLPESRHESGGAAASCATLERKPDGRVDDSVDREEGKEVRRTHFFDTVRYAVWYWTDGLAPDEEQFDEMLDELDQLEQPWDQQEPDDDFWIEDNYGDDWLF